MVPENRTADQILSDIARLEGELAALKGEPLLIVDGGFKVRECPPGGATFTVSWCVPEDANYTEWYSTTEAAKAALTEYARKHKRVVSRGGFYVDLTAPGCQDSRAYVTRRDHGTITIQSPTGHNDFYAVDEHGAPCGHKHATSEEAAECAGLPAPVDVTGRDRDEDEPSIYDRPFPYPEDVRD